MNPDSPAEPPTPGPMMYRLVAGETTAEGIVRDVLRMALTRPRTLCAWGIVVTLVVVFGISQQQPIAAVIVAVLILPLTTLMLYLQIRRAIRRAYPTGSVHTATFVSSSMTITGPLGASDIPYSTCKRLWAGPHAVVLRRRDVSRAYVIPSELVPPAAVAKIRRSAQIR